MYPHQQTTFFSDVFRSTFLFKNKNSVKKVCTQCRLGAERRIQVNMKDIGFKYVGGSKKIKTIVNLYYLGTNILVKMV